MSKLTLRIESDPDATTPREWDTVGVMICFHKKYRLGDPHNLKLGDFADWDEIEAHLREQYSIFELLPLYLYDHSGITMSTNAFSCPWDSGRVGFIFMTEETAQKEVSSSMTDAEHHVHARTFLDSEVRVYSQYIEGDVWYWMLEDEEGNVIDSCSGYYGYEAAEEAGREALLSH